MHFSSLRVSVNMQLLSTFSGISGFSRVTTFQPAEALIPSLDFGVVKMTTGTIPKLKRASGGWTFTTTPRYKKFTSFSSGLLDSPHFDFLHFPSPFEPHYSFRSHLNWLVFEIVISLLIREKLYILTMLRFEPVVTKSQISQLT